MLQRNHFLAPGYRQSRWAKSHGGSQDSGGFARQQLHKSRPYDALLDQCFTAGGSTRRLAGLSPSSGWLHIHPGTALASGAWSQPVAHPRRSTTGPGCPARLDILLWIPAPDTAARNSHRPEKATSNTNSPCYRASPAPALLGPWDSQRIPHASPTRQLLSLWQVHARKPQTSSIKTVPKQTAILPSKGGWVQNRDSFCQPVCEHGRITRFLWYTPWPWANTHFTFSQLLFDMQQSCCVENRSPSSPSPYSSFAASSPLAPARAVPILCTIQLHSCS